MAIRTNVKFKDYIKALGILADRKNVHLTITNCPGSKRRLDLFKKASDPTPYDMFTVHEDKYIYSDDLKKPYLHFGVTKQEFEEILDSL